MKIIGRGSAHAATSETKTEKKGGRFTTTQNEFYKPAGAGDILKRTTYYQVLTG